MKKLLLILSFLFIASQVLADGLQIYDVIGADGTKNLAVVSATTTWSNVIDVRDQVNLSLSYKEASTVGTPTVTFQMEECVNSPLAANVSTTDCSIPILALVGTTTFISMPDIKTSYSSNTGTWVTQGLANIPNSTLIRFKLTGTGTNASDTTVNMKLNKRVK